MTAEAAAPVEITLKEELYYSTQYQRYKMQDMYYH